MQTDTDDLKVDRGDELEPDTKADSAEVPAAEEPEAESKAGEGDKLGSDKDEDTETPEEKAEREREEAEAEAKKRIRIPKARFDEAQAKARAREQALVEEIERLKGGQKASATQQAVADMRSEIEILQDKYEDLILDGKKDDARAVRKQLEGMRETLSDYQTSVKTDAARRGAIEELTYNAQLANLEVKYSVLNPDHASFDEDKVDEVATLLKAFVASGMKRADALAKAAKYVLGDPTPDKGGDEAAAQAAQKRAEDARKKAADANRKQPPSSSGVGKDSDKAGSLNAGGIDLMRISQAEFAKLDEKTLSKMRGDEVE